MLRPVRLVARRGIEYVTGTCRVGTVADMALIYRAELDPAKADLLRDWIARQPWAPTTNTTGLEPVGSYRFDDPGGEVGIESHLVRAASGQTIHVPVTYRDAPLRGADGALVTTMAHSVLGTRWVYDACADPVYASVLIETIVGGGTQAEQCYEPPFDDGPPPVRTRVLGSGSPAGAPTVDRIDSVRAGAAASPWTTIYAGGVRVDVLHIVGADLPAPGDSPTLTGVWPGRDDDDPAVLAVLRRS